MLWTQNLTHYLLPCLTMASYSKLHPWLGQSQSARPKRVSTNTLQQQHLPQEERIVSDYHYYAWQIFICLSI